ncbi:MAG: sulfotransferase [Acidobacteria bacterium]|nr:sulfotransferase [Acidobacteriota bacterium]
MIKALPKKVSWIGHQAWKYAWQAAHSSDAPTMPIFVVGCQRSGSNMLMNVFDQFNEAWIYNEGRNTPAFVNYRIRPNAVLDALIRQTRARYVVFKPLCDSQWVDRLLTIRPNAQAIWIYRDHRDVARSAVRKWGSHQKNVIRGIATLPSEAVGWQAERITPKTIALVKRFYSPQMSDLAGAALKWYIRNQIYFDLNLQHRDDVLLVRYEDLVLYPDQTFPRLFDYLGCRYETEHTREVFSSSVGGSGNIELPDEIETLCDSTLKRLDSVYRSQLHFGHCCFVAMAKVEGFAMSAANSENSASHDEFT